MAIYKVGSPDGKVHRFEGPDGLSQDQVLDEAYFFFILMNLLQEIIP
jgi:hypothetical protein